MEKFDLLVKRITCICLYLNAEDKIRTLSLVSKQWRKLIFAGYAWENLFDKNYDSSWNISNINP